VAVERIFSGLRRRILIGVLWTLAVAGSSPGAASASTWSPAARLTTSGSPFAALGVGAFALPGGTFLLSGYSNYYSIPTGAGYTSGIAGGVFAPPTGPVLTQVASLPDGSSLVAWNGSTVQQRAANGTLLGSPQTLPGNVNAIGVDSSGNATAVGVLQNNTFSLNVYTRPFGGASFTEAPTPIATSGVGTAMKLIGLTVDPSGAAVVTWLAGASTIFQATRATGAASFGAPTVLASNATNGVAPNGVSFASNAAGRAVLVYFDTSGYSAAVRSPGGAFGTPVDITGPLTPSVADSASAVAADGTAATLVSDATAAPTCGTFYSLRAYGLAPSAATWTAAGVFGGTDGDSVAHQALAGGPGSRIDAVWSVDTRSDGQECSASDSYQIDAGTLGGPMSSIFSDSPPPGANYGNGYTGGDTPAIALNSCGDGALIVGIADASNTDTHDGLFTSTTKACPATGSRPSSSVPPSVSGTRSVGNKLTASTGTWSGTAPINFAYQWQRCTPTCADVVGATSGSYTLVSADQGANMRVVVTASNSGGHASASSAEVGPIGPSTSAIKALLLKALTPKGKPAKIAAILKHGGYSLSFKAPSAGKLTYSWYLVPKGAHLSAAKPVLIASGNARFGKLGPVTITIKLTPKGKKLLKEHRKLKLTAKGTYTPAGANAVSATKSFVLSR
jgi:hypothetical protein